MQLTLSKFLFILYYYSVSSIYCFLFCILYSFCMRSNCVLCILCSVFIHYYPVALYSPCIIVYRVSCTLNPVFCVLYHVFCILCSVSYPVFRIVVFPEPGILLSLIFITISECFFKFISYSNGLFFKLNQSSSLSF